MRWWRVQRGDTLVEVVFAIAILAVTLTTAYSVANKSLQVGRESKERLQATQLGENQAERLRAYRDSTAANKLFFRNGNPFPGCNGGHNNPHLCHIDYAGGVFNVVTGADTSNPLFQVGFTVTNTPGGGGGGGSLTNDYYQFQVDVTWTSGANQQQDDSMQTITLADTTQYKPLSCSGATPCGSAGGGGGGGGGGGAPQVTVFTMSLNPFTNGQSLTANWSSTATGATPCLIYEGGFPVSGGLPPKGPASTGPFSFGVSNVDIVFTMTCTDATGSGSLNYTLHVN